MLLRLFALERIPTNLSCSITKRTSPCIPPLLPIMDCSLLSGAMTSGLLEAPGYSPTRASVSPYARPPLAISTGLFIVAVIMPKPIEAAVNSHSIPALLPSMAKVPAIAIVSNSVIILFTPLSMVLKNDCHAPSCPLITIPKENPNALIACE